MNKVVKLFTALFIAVAVFFIVNLFGGSQIKYLPWVDCDFQTPKFGCFYSG